jgi:hypothetical protein
VRFSKESSELHVDRAQWIFETQSAVADAPRAALRSRRIRPIRSDGHCQPSVAPPGSAQAGEDTRTRVASMIGSIVDMRFTKSDAASAHYTSVDPQR